MSSMSMPIVLLAVAATAIGAYGTMPDKAGQKVNRLQPQQATTSEENHSQWASTHWVLTHIRSNTSCQINKQSTKAESTLHLDETCKALIPGAEYIKIWRENTDDTLALNDDNGDTISEFAYSVETGLISISGEPGQLQLTPFQHSQ